MPSVSAPLSASDNHQASTRSGVLFSVFCLFLPLVGALSSHYEVRELQLAVFLALGLIVFATCVRPNLAAVEDRMFQILVWSVSLCLLLSSASFSQYLWGWDIQREFAIFQQVSRTGVWNLESARALVAYDLYYNAAISISILPAIVRAVTGLGSQEVFKFVYPLLYSTVPVILYKIYRRMLSAKSAFLSTYLFMSYWPFYTEVIHIGKMQIAELLLVLSFLIFLSGINEKRSGVVVAMLLSAGVVTSHYSLSYIYIGFVAFSLVASCMGHLAGMLPFGVPRGLSRLLSQPVAVCTLTMMLLCGAMDLTWHMFVAGGSAIHALTIFLSMVIKGIVADFFNPASRPFEALQAAGLIAWVPGFLHDLYRLTNYIVQFCMLVGFIVFARRRNKNLSERKMLPLMTVALGFVGSAVILPFFGGIPFPRIYHISLLFTSTCFVIGAELLESWWRGAYSSLSHNLAVFRLPFSSRGKMIVTATILLSYFLFTSGWVWAVSLDRPTNIIFDSRRMANNPDTKASYYTEVDVPTDVNAALWLKSYGESGHVCSDYISAYHVLTAYGELGSTLLRHCDLQKSYIFLSELNMLHGIGTDYGEPFGEPSLYEVSADLFTHESNKLYSNGGTAIHASPLMGP